MSTVDLTNEVVQAVSEHVSGADVYLSVSDCTFVLTISDYEGKLSARELIEATRYATNIIMKNGYSFKHRELYHDGDVAFIHWYRL